MRRSAQFKSEAALAAVVIDWLRQQHWEVYQEVELADIVAVQGPRLWVIECKLTLSFALIEQAHRWVGRAHQVSIATPRARSRNDFYIAEHILRPQGIGCLTVRATEAADGDALWSQSVSELCAPALTRRIAPELRARLCEEHKTFAAAGSPSGKRWTAFKSTCQRVRQHVNGRPGVTLRDLVSGVNHHYASGATARACLSHYVRKGLIPGIRCERDGKHLRFYPDEATEAA